MERARMRRFALDVRPWWPSEASNLASASRSSPRRGPWLQALDPADLGRRRIPARHQGVFLPDLEFQSRSHLRQSDLVAGGGEIRCVRLGGSGGAALFRSALPCERDPDLVS